MKKTILLVDDEINILDIQNRYLIQAGYDVLVAHDGKEGLELFRKKSIDLIITDIMMPNMDGYDFISEVQYIAPNQPFLFTTAKTSEQDKIYGLSLGADDFIVKPFSPRELVLRVTPGFCRPRNKRPCPQGKAPFLSASFLRRWY